MFIFFLHPSYHWWSLKSFALVKDGLAIDRSVVALVVKSINIVFFIEKSRLWFVNLGSEKSDYENQTSIPTNDTVFQTEQKIGRDRMEHSFGAVEWTFDTVEWGGPARLAIQHTS